MHKDKRTRPRSQKAPLIPPDFAALAKPYRVQLMAACLVAVMIAGTSLIMPLGYGLLIDTLVERRPAANVTLIAVALVAVTCGKLGLGFVSEYLLRGTGERIVYDLRCKLYAHLLALDVAFFNKRQLGELTAALTNDVTAVRGGLTDALMWVVVHGLRLVALVALMFALNVRLGVLVLLTWPLAVGIARLAGRALEQLASVAQGHLARSAAVAQETLAALRQVRLFNRDGYELGRYRRHLDRALYTSQQSISMRAGLAASLELVFALVAIVLFWFGGREVSAGRLTVGTLVTFLFYAEATAQSVTMVTNAYNTARQARGAAHRVLAILSEKPTVATRLGATQLCAASRLELSGVCFSHDSRPLLRDISFVVEPGAVVAIVGPSGAGKSTLLDLIVRLHDPTSGRITVDGHDLRDVDLGSLRNQITLVSQDTRLFSISARETVRYAASDASDAEVEHASVLAAADEFIRAMPSGYDTVIGDNGVLLSGGQRQRLALAQAFVRTSGLLVLDESTSAIDPRTEATILRTVLNRQNGRTTVLVSHRLSVAALADEIIVLDEGRVVGRGTHEQLLQNTATYREMVQSQLPEAPELSTLGKTTQPQRRHGSNAAAVSDGVASHAHLLPRSRHAGRPEGAPHTRTTAP